MISDSLLLIGKVLMFIIMFGFHGYHYMSLTLMSEKIATFAKVEERLKQFEAESVKQNDRIWVLEFRQNKHQREEKTLLKPDELLENRDEMKELNAEWINREINDLEKAKIVNSKRAARLMPLSLLIKSKDDANKEPNKPPSSCKDLNDFGHTLNGIYLIKKNKNFKIDVIFCDFLPNQRSSTPFLETRLGYLDIKSGSGVYFYVQRHTNKLPIKENGVIRFDVERLNIGGAMNLSTGVFTAPKAGLYSFSFSMLKDGFNYDWMAIHLRLNGFKIGLSSVGRGLLTSPATLQSNLKLKKGDRIDLFKSKSGDLLVDKEHNNHFSGCLLEEDLEI